MPPGPVQDSHLTNYFTRCRLLLLLVLKFRLILVLLQASISLADESASPGRIFLSASATPILCGDGVEV